MVFGLLQKSEGFYIVQNCVFQIFTCLTICQILTLKEDAKLLYKIFKSKNLKTLNKLIKSSFSRIQFWNVETFTVFFCDSLKSENILDNLKPNKRKLFFSQFSNIPNKIRIVFQALDWFGVLRKLVNTKILVRMMKMIRIMLKVIKNGLSDVKTRNFN